ncbi:MAG: type II secretion system protein J [Bacteriovoracaceae bacterium]
MKTKIKMSQKGFTLIEVLVGVSIAGLLGLVVMNLTEQSQKSVAKMNNIQDWEEIRATFNRMMGPTDQFKNDFLNSYCTSFYDGVETKDAAPKVFNSSSKLVQDLNQNISSTNLLKVDSIKVSFETSSKKVIAIPVLKFKKTDKPFNIKTVMVMPTPIVFPDQVANKEFIKVCNQGGMNSLNCEVGASPIWKEGGWVCGCAPEKVWEKNSGGCIVPIEGKYTSSWIGTGGCWNSGFSIVATRTLNWSKTAYRYKVDWSMRADYALGKGDFEVFPGKKVEATFSNGRDSQSIAFEASDDLVTPAKVYANGCKGGAPGTLKLQLIDTDFAN